MPYMQLLWLKQCSRMFWILRESYITSWSFPNTPFLFNAIMYTFVLELKSACTVEGWENSLCSPPAQWVAMEGMDRICFKIRK